MFLEDEDDSEVELLSTDDEVDSASEEEEVDSEKENDETVAQVIKLIEKNNIFSIFF